jgi:hypothetical protein
MVNQELVSALTGCLYGSKSTHFFDLPDLATNLAANRATLPVHPARFSNVFLSADC